MASGLLQYEVTRAVAIARSSFETTGGRRRVDARHVHARDDAAKRRAIEATRRSDATRRDLARGEIRARLPCARASDDAITQNLRAHDRGFARTAREIRPSS